jgi:hypothetical protein
VSISGEIAQNLLGTAEWALAVDHPFAVAQWREVTNDIYPSRKFQVPIQPRAQLEDALVTIDTMGCQVQIAEIVAHKADGGAVCERRTPDVILVIKPW